MEGDEVQELSEGEGKHGEVDAAPPEAEEADGGAAEHGEKRARGESEKERADLELGERDAGAVGAEPVVGRVAEGQEPRVPVEQVEAQREETEDQHLRGQ